VIEAGESHDAPVGAQHRRLGFQQPVRARRISNLELRRGFVARLAVCAGVHSGAAREDERAGAVPQLQGCLHLRFVVLAPRRGRAEDDEGKLLVARAILQPRHHAERHQPLVRALRVGLSHHNRGGEFLLFKRVGDGGEKGKRVVSTFCVIGWRKRGTMGRGKKQTTKKKPKKLAV
jgi:hypothetical protein